MASPVKLLGHMVYFTLKDRSSAAVQQLIDACHKYLTGHPGTIFFAAGTLTPDLARPVNDREFDVALQVVFDSRASHDLYQVAPRHLQFIEENKPNWAKVRVFDADISC
jgi:hypothetical protein